VTEVFGDGPTGSLDGDGTGLDIDVNTVGNIDLLGVMDEFHFL
jgi:hypothetical protein